jgi:hypothetical protein
MQPKILPIVLPPALYRKLELDGRAEERDAVQQARWILKRALSEQPALPSDPRGPGAAA